MIIRYATLDMARKLYAATSSPTVTKYSLEAIEDVFSEASTLQAEEEQLLSLIDSDVNLLTGTGTDEQFANYEALKKIYSSSEAVVGDTSRRHTNECYPVNKWQKNLAKQRQINRQLAKQLAKLVERS